MQTKREETRMIWNGTERSIFRDTKKIVCYRKLHIYLLLYLLLHLQGGTQKYQKVTLKIPFTFHVITTDTKNRR